MEDYYQILGVSRSATKEEIKKAYRKLAHKHHPDKGGDEKTFKKISEAYHVLSNEEKRKQYDRFGKSGPGAGNQHHSDFGGFQGDFDFGDIFEEFFGFGSRSGGGRKRRGEDIKINVTTSLEKIIKDEERVVTLRKMFPCEPCQGDGSAPGTKKKTCSTCKGKGKVRKEAGSFLGSFAQIAVCPDCHGEGEISEKKCSSCQGEGRVEKEEKIKFTIPAGIDSGQTLKIAQKGNAGRKGTPSGDLLVEIEVKNNTSFKRRGEDLFYSTIISYSKAALGGKIEVPLLSGGKISLKIPSGTISGKVFRISKKGLPRLSGYGQGDLYVTVNIDVPKKINKKQKELLEKLQQEGI